MEKARLSLKKDLLGNLTITNNTVKGEGFIEDYKVDYSEIVKELSVDECRWLDNGLDVEIGIDDSRFSNIENWFYCLAGIDYQHLSRYYLTQSVN